MAPIHRCRSRDRLVHHVLEVYVGDVRTVCSTPGQPYYYWRSPFDPAFETDPRNVEGLPAAEPLTCLRCIGGKQT